MHSRRPHPRQHRRPIVRNSGLFRPLVNLVIIVIKGNDFEVFNCLNEMFITYKIPMKVTSWNKQKLHEYLTFSNSHRECVTTVLSRLQRNYPVAFRRALSLDRCISYCTQRMCSKLRINRVSRYMAMLTIFSCINIACRRMWIWWRTVFRCVWRGSWYGCRPIDSA